MLTRSVPNLSREPQTRAASWLSSLLLLVLSLMPGLASAVHYVLPSDSELASRADAIVEVEVVGRRPAALQNGVATTTLYTVKLVEPLLTRADLSDELSIEVPGVLPEDGHGWRVEGTPVLPLGARMLLFLDRGKADSWHLSDFNLGVFQLDSTHQLWRRDLSNGRNVSPDSNASFQRARHAEAFRRWLRAGARTHSSIDYLVESPALTDTDLARKSAQQRRRWQRFDQDLDVSWRHLDVQQLEPTINQSRVMQQALSAWTNDPDTNVRYRYGGTVALSEVSVEPDRVFPALVLWNRPFRGEPSDPSDAPYSCQSGGILGWSSWLPALGNDAEHLFDGERFDTVEAVRVVVNQGAECFLNGPDGSGLNAEELIAHEMGHTLGLAHSCDDGGGSLPACGALTPDSPLLDALMRANPHGGRGATLAQYDRDALFSRYADVGARDLRLLSIRAEGSGQGTVEVDQNGTGTQSCADACDVIGPSGQPVTLEAVAADGSVFLGWGGDCAGTRAFSVQLSLGRAQTCEARFAERPAGDSVVTVNTYQECGLSISPSDWRVLVPSGDTLTLRLTTEVPPEEVTLQPRSNCPVTRLGDFENYQWEVGPLNVDCTVDVLIPAQFAPDCSQLFADRFENDAP